MNELKKNVAGNALLILLLGACPAMGATTTVLGAAGIGIAVLAVMLLSCILLTVLKKAIPECARVPAAVLVIAGFASLVQMVMNAFLPEMYQLMGVYAAVVAVDLLVFGVVEENNASIVAALKTGCTRFVNNAERTLLRIARAWIGWLIFLVIAVVVVIFLVRRVKRAKIARAERKAACTARRTVPAKRDADAPAEDSSER